AAKAHRECARPVPRGVDRAEGMVEAPRRRQFDPALRRGLPLLPGLRMIEIIGGHGGLLQAQHIIFIGFSTIFLIVLRKIAAVAPSIARWSAESVRVMVVAKR